MRPHPELNLLTHFQTLPDPRTQREPEHKLIDILVVAVCTLLCGGEGFNDMEDFGAAKHDWFKTFLELPNAGYTGVEKRAEIVALERKMDWPIARQRGPIKAMMEGAEKEALKAAEKLKASVRAFVEHPFHIVKNIFRHRKVRYRGLAKNGHQLHTLFGLANVMIGARAVTP